MVTIVPGESERWIILRREKKPNQIPELQTL